MLQQLAELHAHVLRRLLLCTQIAPAQPPKLEEPEIRTKPEEADEEVRYCCQTCMLFVQTVAQLNIYINHL